MASGIKARWSKRIRVVTGFGAVLVCLVAAWRVRRWYRHERPVPVPLAADFRLGYNMDYPGDWSNLPPFIDHFKNARGFTGVCADEDDCHPTQHLDLDARGWVKSLKYRDDPARAYERVEVIINSSRERSDIGKAFVVTWQGQGSIEIFGAADAALDAGARRIRFELPGELLALRLTEIDPAHTGDHLRDIRVYRADQGELLEAGQIFNPELLGFLAPFRSLRFMDWMLSNEPGICSGGAQEGESCYAISNEKCDGGLCNMPGSWKERPQVDQAIWLGSAQFLDNAAPERGRRLGGYPLETMVALANAAHAAPHFNLPAHHDDDYARRFAEYVKANLAPDLPVSVEYSNEVWNWTFPQANYAKARGEQLWPGNGTAWVQYMAVRTHNMCRTFRQTFAGDEHRLRCLISPQTGWRELAPTVLDCPDWTASHPDTESCTQYVDAINVSGYFAGCLQSRPEVVSSWLDEGPEPALAKGFQQLERGDLIEGCEGEAADNLGVTMENYRYYAQLAVRRGLGLEVYEGGTHFDYSGDDPRVKAFLVDLSRDPRMYDLYRRNYAAFRDAGGSTFNVWGWIAPNDAWANADSLLDRQHPKYRAAADFSRELEEPRRP